MPTRPSGLWVPHPTPSNKFTAQDVKPENRQFLGGNAQYDRLGLTYDTFDHWRKHTRGRADSCAEVLTKVAVLRSRGGINDSEPIAVTGAVYQDFRGAPEYYQRGHRFPCNPWVGVFTLPELALRSSPVLWREMVNPLAKTDIIPNYVNYGDGLIEKAGTYESIGDAIKEVVHEQNKSKPVNPKLIQHVMQRSVLPNLRDSYEEALERVRKDFDKEFERALVGATAFSPEAMKAMEQWSLNTRVDLAKPTVSRQSVEDYLTLCIRDAATYQPPLLQTPSLETEIDRVQSLPKSE